MTTRLWKEETRKFLGDQAVRKSGNENVLFRTTGDGSVFSGHVVKRRGDEKVFGEHVIRK
jgi:hypothetical protein